MWFPQPGVTYLGYGNVTNDYELPDAQPEYFHDILGTPMAMPRAMATPTPQAMPQTPMSHVPFRLPTCGDATPRIGRERREKKRRDTVPRRIMPTPASSTMMPDSAASQTDPNCASTQAPAKDAPDGPRNSTCPTAGQQATDGPVGVAESTADVDIKDG